MQFGILHLWLLALVAGAFCPILLQGMIVARTSMYRRFLQRWKPLTIFVCNIGRVELELSSNSKFSLTILLTSKKVGWWVVIRKGLSSVVVSFTTAGAISLFCPADMPSPMRIGLQGNLPYGNKGTVSCFLLWRILPYYRWGEVWGIAILQDFWWHDEKLI